MHFMTKNLSILLTGAKRILQVACANAGEICCTAQITQNVFDIRFFNTSVTARVYDFVPFPRIPTFSDGPALIR